jgi:multidrug resistance efflux pump
MKIRSPKKLARLGTALLSVLVAVVAVYSLFSRNGASANTVAETPAPVAREKAPAIVLASPGRVEARSDVVNVGAATDGLIRSIRVVEGQVVKRGAVLAELACDDLKSSLAVANANRDSLMETRVRVERGSRPEEREAAAQKTAAAKAVLDQATAQLGRISKLYASQEVSRQTFEEARRDQEVAQAQYQQAQRNQELVNAGPLPEDLARADANLDAAEGEIKLAQDKLDKCVVRAPIDGAVLRVLMREGESFGLVSPRPLFTMADVSGRRVRAEVDEDDIAKVHVGQKLLVSADAFGRRTFSGVVTRLADVMGRKSVETGDPAQKADRDILEVTADLNQATALPVGLRVTVQFVR